MARVKPDEVREIIGTDPDLSLTPFISPAHGLTNYVASKDVNGLLTRALLTDIEKYLSAHFYAHRDQLYQEKTVGRASAVYQGKTDIGLDSTQYGQTAKLLDVTGTLANLDKQTQEGVKTAGAFWMGTDYRNAPSRSDVTE